MLFGPEHVKRYIETDGEEGHSWREGTKILILTTKGRRSGDDYLVVASKGGADEPPAWYLNLEADPQVEVQVLDQRFSAHARDATAAEKPVLWQTMVGAWPHYDEYQTKTTREIPVVILERD